MANSARGDRFAERAEAQDDPSGDGLEAPDGMGMDAVGTMEEVPGGQAMAMATSEGSDGDGGQGSGDGGPPDSEPPGETTPAACPSPVIFTGQVRGDDADVPDGGVPQFSPYPSGYETGLAHVISAFPEMQSEVEMSLQVDGVTVVATNFYNERDDPPRNQTQFWVADATGFVHVRLAFDDPSAVFPESQVRVGQKISFRVTKVTRDGYGPKISAAEGFTLDDVGQPVYIWDADRRLTEADIGRLVRVTGTVDGPPSSCGGTASCWALDFGNASITLRSSTAFPPAPGGCLTFVGPVGAFDGRIQLDTINFTWLQVYP